MTGGPAASRSLLKRLMAEYGIVLVLAGLCAYFSVATISDQPLTGKAGGEAFARVINKSLPPGSSVALFSQANEEDSQFVEAAKAALSKAHFEVVSVTKGQPRDARAELDRLLAQGGLSAIATSQAASGWTVFEAALSASPDGSKVQTFHPKPTRGSNFLKPENLLNIANQIVVIAILAIGMTLVIITGGIDLSVGSLIALSAVVTTLVVRAQGAENAGLGAMTTGALAGISICGLVGLFSGAMVAYARIPAFIVTLAMMLVGSGAAFILAKGQSIYQVPESFITVGRGELYGVPLAVLLMIVLYAKAHVFMSRARLGRTIYAVGANQEAARLSGISVSKTLLFVYALSGVLAGLGGVVMASQLKSGAPTYGQMYELYVVAAVVVGGTSLSGGQGKVFGTLIGALIIAVIQNGMNLLGVESYTQKVVLGLVVLGAVMVDRLRRRAG